MPLDAAFLDDALYDPSGLLIDEVLEVDEAKSLVRVRMPTNADLPITRSQRADEKKHPRHVSGGLMVHMTGVAAFAHFYYVLKLRHSEGWTGYGVRVHDAKFMKLAPVGPPVELVCQMIKSKKLGGKILARYRFEFFQDGEKIYEGEQSALWIDTKVVSEGGAVEL
ncbi:MAG: hypothetical protein HYV07_28610 [Deltaproteobacteria bacterium]|nr:hypothetical protein [Deltaproteobacteria bacterium]